MMIVPDDDSNLREKSLNVPSPQDTMNIIKMEGNREQISKDAGEKTDNSFLLEVFISKKLETETFVQPQCASFKIMHS